jgi:Leucine-rich repeat (LRR) protein
MNDKNDNLPIVRKQHRLTTLNSGSKSIISGMVADVLSGARDLSKSKLYRLHDYELCEPDYEQMLLWASANDMHPEEFVGCFNRDQFEVRNGKIRRVSFFADSLFIPDEWVDGLQIEALSIVGSFVQWTENGYDFQGNDAWLPSKTTVSIRKNPSLRILDISENFLPELDLSFAPELRELNCENNLLAELALSPVPKLRVLKCGDTFPYEGWSETSYKISPTNSLTEVDLSSVPKLEILFCCNNDLTELDLSSVPELRELYCDKNDLTELDLSSVPKLEILSCCNNDLTELDLSSVPELRELYCDKNDLTELDLSSVPKLEKLACSSNLLTELDLSSVPELELVDRFGGPI